MFICDVTHIGIIMNCKIKSYKGEITGIAKTLVKCRVAVSKIYFKLL